MKLWIWIIVAIVALGLTWWLSTSMQKKADATLAATATTGADAAAKITAGK